MPVTTAFAASVVGIVAILVAILVWFRRSRGSPSTKGSIFRGPSSMHFTCAGCAGQFAHTKRTVAAWERGTRRVFCDACHRKWRNAQPLQSLPSPTASTATRREYAKPPDASRTSAPAASGGTRSPAGCLGVVLLMVLVPGAFLVAFAIHA
jgi:hypothetical protein